MTSPPWTTPSRCFFSRITPEISVILTQLRIGFLSQPVIQNRFLNYRKVDEIKTAPVQCGSVARPGRRMMKPSNVVRRTRPKAAPLPGSSGAGSSRRQQASPGKKREAAIHGKVDAGLPEPSKPALRAIGGERHTSYAVPYVHLCNASRSLLPSIVLYYAVLFHLTCCCPL